jgi:glycosyltransferase involved in cell wall biosynthesis
MDPEHRGPEVSAFAGTLRRLASRLAPRVPVRHRPAVPRVAFTLDPRASGGGSRSFARVLADWLPRHGFEVSVDPEAPCELLLVFAHEASLRTVRRQKRRGARIVHRIDERLDPDASPARQRKHAFIATVNELADLTVFQSAFARRSMSPICRGERWTVIHNGVDATVFAPEGAVDALAGQPKILHVSWSTGASKRLDLLDELLSVLPHEARVYLVGRQRESALPSLADPRIRVVGVVGREEVARYMRSADLLFFPSEYDPCPNTVIEALSCGLPVLYHPSGGTPELIGDAGVPMSGAMAAGVAAVLAARSELRARGLARAAELSAARVVERYAAAMRELLDA